MYLIFGQMCFSLAECKFGWFSEQCRCSYRPQKAPPLYYLWMKTPCFLWLPGTMPISHHSC